MSDHAKSTLLALSPLAIILSLGIPVMNIIAPLIFWLIWKNKSSLVDSVGRNVLSSQISWTIWMTIAGALLYHLTGHRFIFIIYLAWLILTIIHAVKVAAKNYGYTMPLTIKFLR